MSSSIQNGNSLLLGHLEQFKKRIGEGNEHTFKKCMFAKLSSSVFWHLHQNKLCKCHKEVIVKLQNQISEAYENIAVH